MKIDRLPKNPNLNNNKKKIDGKYPFGALGIVSNDLALFQVILISGFFLLLLGYTPKWFLFWLFLTIFQEKIWLLVGIRRVDITVKNRHVPSFHNAVLERHVVGVSALGRFSNVFATTSQNKYCQTQYED